MDELIGVETEPCQIGIKPVGGGVALPPSKVCKVLERWELRLDLKVRKGGFMRGQLAFAWLGRKVGWIYGGLVLSSEVV